MSSLGDLLQELRPYWVKALLADVRHLRSSLLEMIGTVYAHIFFELIHVLFMWKADILIKDYH